MSPGIRLFAHHATNGGQGGGHSTCSVLDDAAALVVQVQVIDAGPRRQAGRDRVRRWRRRSPPICGPARRRCRGCSSARPSRRAPSPRTAPRRSWPSRPWSRTRGSAGPPFRMLSAKTRISSGFSPGPRGRAASGAGHREYAGPGQPVGGCKRAERVGEIVAAGHPEHGHLRAAQIRDGSHQPIHRAARLGTQFPQLGPRRRLVVEAAAVDRDRELEPGIDARDDAGEVAAPGDPGHSGAVRIHLGQGAKQRMRQDGLATA